MTGMPLVGAGFSLRLFAQVKACSYRIIIGKGDGSLFLMTCHLILALFSLIIISMDEKRIKQLLSQVKTGQVDVEGALKKLKGFPYEDLNFARIDTHRHLRRGFPEVIFCQNKTVEQVVEIIRKMQESEEKIMATRASPEVFQVIKQAIPQAIYYPQARIVLVGQEEKVANPSCFILIITAGTGDILVAEEAAVTARIMGNRVKTLYDVGVAGVHRLLDMNNLLTQANVLIVVAGMEGALPSVVGGLVGKPVIALPTSVGYGVSLGGLAALMGMLNSCVPGVAVVNIDNGFGAGYLASLINGMNTKK